MKNLNQQWLRPVQKTGLVVVLAILMVVGSLVALQMSVFAKHSASGAGNCGNFIDAVGARQSS
jgi:hypothetical protein